MATITTDRPEVTMKEEVKQVRKIWGWFLALGIVQMAVGLFAVTFVFEATYTSVVLLGILLLIASGVQMGAAIWPRDWGGFFLYLLLGVLYIVAGGLMLRQPLLAAEALTLMLAAAFLVGGIFRIGIALAERFAGWGYVLCNGILTAGLGMLIWLEWPWSGLWVLGMFVGIELIVNGATWAIVSIGVRKGLKQFAAC
jgi:uncharacterized membrane protein HdeD (DUF308 family)